MDDVAIAGAGPAGALAATILATAGLKVRLFDRARFPRPKLCGDTLNPGALEVLRRHADTATLIEQSDPIHGMVLTGPRGVTITGDYGPGVTGRAISRSAFDRWLLDRALAAGAAVDERVVIRDVVTADDRVAGVVAVARDGRPLTHPARIVIAADGRRSAIAIGRGLSRQPARPRRWAIGAYFTGVSGTTSFGEMHVRRGHYIGVAPIPGGLTNVCLVVPGTGDVPWSRPADALMTHLRADSRLSARFEHAQPASSAVMLGPMAVDANAAGEPGLLLAGDAAGFIDPMTGDGMRFALLGAELAAATAMEVLGGGVPFDRAHLVLAERRRLSFQSKWRFNRAMRSLVDWPAGVSGAATAARAFPSVFTRMIRYAGDC